MSDEEKETMPAGEQALAEIMTALNTENVTEAAQLVCELAARQPLIWLDSKGAICFAPMTYRVVQRIIGALEGGMVVRR